MKLKLQINPKALNDTSRALLPKGIAITPPIGEDFWFYRVAVSSKQAIVGFPKFSVIGIGFQHEQDWNTNLPSGTDAVEIYEHIRHNKQDAKIPRQRCIDAIRLIQAQVLAQIKQTAIDRLKTATDDEERLAALSVFLRHTSSWQVAQCFDQDDRIRLKRTA